MGFTGLSTEAVNFYRDLEAHNDREWWLANKHRYDEFVKQPLDELAAILAPTFGEMKVYRPYRDVRFSHDKTPYKTHQGLYAHSNSFTGWYFQVDAEGIQMGGGNYFMSGDQLSRYRSAVLNDATGVQLQQVVDELTGVGYELTGEVLKTRPRGVDEDAPRLELLRHKSLALMLKLGTPEWMSTPEMAGYVSDAWDEVRPLMEWLKEFVGDSQDKRR